MTYLSTRAFWIYEESFLDDLLKYMKILPVGLFLSCSTLVSFCELLSARFIADIKRSLSIKGSRLTPIHAYLAPLMSSFMLFG